MNFSQGLIHHSTEHFRRPEISSGEHAENSCYAHHHVEVPDYEVGAVEIDINRRLRQKKSADTAGDEHRDKPQSEEGRAFDWKVGAVKAANPDQHQNGCRN